MKQFEHQLTYLIPHLVYPHAHLIEPPQLMRAARHLLAELVSGQVNLPTYEHHCADWYFQYSNSWGNHYRLLISKHIILAFSRR